jgi:hypothetical protein
MRILYNDLWRGKTLTVSSEATGYTGVNTQHAHLSKAWRTTGVASEWIKIDTTTSITIDAIAIIAHNLTPGATIKIEANATDAWGAPSFSITLNPADPLILSTFASQTYRWWRVTIADAANPAGYISIGRIYFCMRWESVEPIDRSFRPSVEDTTNVSKSISGQLFADIGVRQRVYKFSMGTMKDETKVSLEAIILNARNYDPVIVMPDNTISSNGLTRIQPLYSTFIKETAFMANGPWGWDDDGLEFKEAL